MHKQKKIDCIFGKHLKTCTINVNTPHVMSTWLHTVCESPLIEGRPAGLSAQLYLVRPNQEELKEAQNP